MAYLTPFYFDEASYLGGGERYPLNLAKGVAGTGAYEVELVSYGDIPAVQRSELSPGVSLRVLPAARRREGTERLSWEVISAVRDADLVHIHQVFARASEVGMMVAKLLGKPVCVTDHGGATSRLGQSLGMLELADRVIANSQFGASLLSTSTPKHVVRGGVDDSFFSPPAANGRRDRVVYVGRLLPHKGIDQLLEALPEELPLTICGRGHHGEYLRRLQTLARGKRVEFVTDAGDEQVRGLLRSALAVVLPSVYVDCYGAVQPWPELMGLSLLEGMACGAPAICSRVGGMPEYVEHDETGFIFDQRDELSDFLRRLAADPELVAELGRRGLGKVADSFGLRSAGGATAGIYDELLDQGQGR